MKIVNLSRILLSWVFITIINHASLGRALAHDGGPPEPADLWQTWSWEPGVLLGLAFAGLAYGRGVRLLWGKAGLGRGIAMWQGLAFSGGLIVLFVALVSPIDALGEVLFSVHMLQHLLLILVAAPLLVLGAPHRALAWSLPVTLNRRLAPWWHRRTWLQKVSSAITNPFVAWLLQTAALWLWHLPSLYQAAIQDEFLHLLEHASMFGTALLFWWVLRRFAPSGRSRPNTGIGILYVFTMMISNGILGVLIAFSASPWYPIYTHETAVWGLSALEDQQLAGLIMWVPAGLIYASTGLFLFASWLRAMDAQEQGG